MQNRGGFFPWVVRIAVIVIVVLLGVNIFIMLQNRKADSAGENSTASNSSAEAVTKFDLDAEEEDLGSDEEETSEKEILSWEEQLATALPSDLEDGETAVGFEGTYAIPFEGPGSGKESLNFEELREIYPDLVAWLVIPGSDIDVPVVQTPEGEAEDFYDTHNAMGETDLGGAIHISAGNEVTFTDPHTVILGDFNGISLFSDKDFFDTNRYIYIMTEEKTVEYKAIAAYNGDDSDLLLKYNCYDIDIYSSYIDEILSQSGIGVNVDTDSAEAARETWNLLTLSGATSDPSVRFLVQGYLTGAQVNE